MVALFNFSKRMDCVDREQNVTCASITFQGHLSKKLEQASEANLLPFMILHLWLLVLSREQEQYVSVPTVQTKRS